MSWPEAVFYSVVVVTVAVVGLTLFLLWWAGRE